jgi:hypothetical protein
VRASAQRLLVEAVAEHGRTAIVAASERAAPMRRMLPDEYVRVCRRIRPDLHRSAGVDGRLIAVGYGRVRPHEWAWSIDCFLGYWEEAARRPHVVGSCHNHDPEVVYQAWRAGVSARDLRRLGWRIAAVEPLARPARYGTQPSHRTVRRAVRCTLTHRALCDEVKGGLVALSRRNVRALLRLPPWQVAAAVGAYRADHPDVLRPSWTDFASYLHEAQQALEPSWRRVLSRYGVGRLDWLVIARATPAALDLAAALADGEPAEVVELLRRAARVEEIAHALAGEEVPSWRS